MPGMKNELLKAFAFSNQKDEAQNIPMKSSV